MPKTMKNKFNDALTYDKLMEAHLKCQKGKKSRENVIKFNMKKEEYIQWLYEQIKNRTYKHRKYTIFYVSEPKKRKIEAARYLDRVVHRWCYDNFLEPLFVPIFIQNSYACIKGRGMHAVALDVQKAMRRCKRKWGDYYVLKMDISKYFASINKDILLSIIKRKVHDKDILWLISQVMYSQREESGIPIRKSDNPAICKSIL